MSQSLPPAPVDNAPPPPDDTAKKKSQAFIHTNTWAAMKLWFKQLQSILKGVVNDGNGNITFPGSVTVTGTATATGLQVNGNAAITGSLNGLSATPGMSVQEQGSLGFVTASAPVGLRAYNSTQPGIPSGAFTTITGWGTVSFNPGGGFNGSTGVYTVPEAGYYQVGGSNLFTSAAWTNGNQWQLQLAQNGAAIAQTNVAVTLTGTYFSSSMVVETVTYCNAGDQLSLLAFQSSGASVAIYIAPYIMFHAMKVYPQ